MQLTFLSESFKGLVFAVAMGGFLTSWIAERKLLPGLARMLGRAYPYLRPNYRKKRRQYKVLREETLR